MGSVRGLYVYHRDLDKFTLHQVFTGGVDDIAMPICFKDGKIWCFNRQYQLATFDVVTKQSTVMAKLPIRELPSVHIYELIGRGVFYFRYPFVGIDNNIYIVDDEMLLSFNTKSKNIKTEHIRNKKINSCAYDQTEDKLYLGTSNGIDVFNLKSKQWSSIILKEEVPSTATVKQICVNERYIVSLINDRLTFTEKESKRSISIKSSLSVNFTRVSAIGIDKNNRIWLCDDGKGQAILDFKEPILSKQPNEKSAYNYFETSGVVRFAELSDGGIVVPSFVDNKFNRILFDKNKEIVKIEATKQLYRCTTDSLRDGVWYYSELLSDMKGENRKIIFADNKGGETTFFEDFGFQSLGNQKDMQVLPDGRLICSFAKGLYWLDLSQKNLVKVEEEKQSSPFKINLTSKGRIAVSYLNGDMVLYQTGQDFALKPLRKILAGVQSFYLQEDTIAHRFWVGTNQGVYVLDENFNTIKKIDANNGLAGTYIYGLLLDDQGNAYCSHQRGLSSIDGKSFHVLNFDKSDGIQDWDFNNKAFFKASDGTMYFGGSSGFNYFKPPLVPSSFYRPEVYVDEFLVNGVSYNTDKCANLISEARLDAGENNIEIHAIVKDLVNGRSRKLVYRLKETDYNWTFLPNNTSILFNNLAPGRYTLELGTYDKYSNQMLIQKKISISIAAPYYATTWFLFLVTSVSTAVVFLVIGSIKESRRRSKLHEEKVLEEQRQAITADLHDDIGASLSSLQINSSVARRLMDSDSSQVHSFLEKIENQSQDLADKIGDIIWSMKPGEQEFMTLSSRIKNFVNDILGATTISYMVDIEPEVDSLAQSIPLRKNLIMIAKESVNNAAKYSQASKLELTLRVEGINLMLSVKDNGVGFESDAIQGNGLYNMKKRAQELGGELTITSKKGLGTEVSLSVPYP